MNNIPGLFQGPVNFEPFKEVQVEGMFGARVIPAPIAYVKIVAVKKTTCHPHKE